MIQRANDPNASRGWRPAGREDKAQAAGEARRRPSHAWPFLSPHVSRPAPQDRPRNTSNDSGS
jgi:hypothetical protein